MISPTIIQEKHSNENNEAIINKIFSIEYNKTSSSIQNQIAEINESKIENDTLKLSKFKLGPNRTRTFLIIFVFFFVKSSVMLHLGVG